MKLTLLAFAIALVLSLVFGAILLPLLKRLHIGQTIRSEGPQSHLVKGGTPTMGGLIFILAVLPVLILCSSGSQSIWLWLFSFLAFGLIGCGDDLLKVVWHRSLGLKAWQKLVGQFAAAAILLIAAERLLGTGTHLIVPFSGAVWDLGFWYYPLIAIFFVGMVNAVNLTDGLDGLAGGISIMVLIGYWLIALALANQAVDRGGDFVDLAVAAAALSGALAGFLVYNHHPAKVFMGDTGSLALGGAVVALALLTKTEFILLLLGGVYLLEAVSVMIQVASFQLFRRRVFLMSPLHHHYEMKGWPETKVVIFFWGLAAALVFLGVLIFSLTPYPPQ